MNDRHPLEASAACDDLFIQLRYFASIREGLGRDRESWTTRAANVGGLRDELIAHSPHHAALLARGRAVRVAVNQSLAADTTSLSAGCEVAFFPPVTGG